MANPATAGLCRLTRRPDKALPPAEMLRQFIAQKLDAEKYDLKVTFIRRSTG